MIKREKYSIQKQLMISISFFMILSASIVVSTNFIISSANIEKQLQIKTSLTCQKLTAVLADDIWNMDNSAIENYVKTYPWGLFDIAYIKILTEFNDPIYTVKFVDAADVYVCREPVYHNDNIIGFIEVATDKSLYKAARVAIIKSWISIVALAVTTILLILFLITRILITNPIKILTNGLKEIKNGNYNFRFPLVNNSAEALLIYSTVDGMSVEIGKRNKQLQHEISIRKATEIKLKEFSTSLEAQVDERTHSLQKAYKDLQKESIERRQLQEEILSISDKERQRIGSDLHDSLGQQLTGVSLLLSILTKTLEKKGIPEVEAANSLKAQMKNVIKEARSLSHGLSPLRLDDDGLLTTLQHLATETETVRNITCNFECHDESNVNDKNAAMHIYRITQEAISNAHKHGKADVINIRMQKHSEYETMCELHIEDNGCGIDEAKLSSDGIGLRIMKFRAESIGGSISIEKNDNGGTTVKLIYSNK